ncbi:hypothetical protein KP509_23G013600 [Ceratopteris richardii]|uniref:Uncharacterized protein n=1 Tax=Ceratopteris richardii TaxID=49495 RepID=A0A8T2S061_CERRI|nr:hypothetical protein KP509_23G013600 [Ceratopteris richardii]
MVPPFSDGCHGRFERGKETKESTRGKEKALRRLTSSNKRSVGRNPSGRITYDGLKGCHTLERAKRFIKRGRLFGKTKRRFSNLSIALKDGQRQMTGRKIGCAK